MTTTLFNMTKAIENLSKIEEAPALELLENQGIRTVIELAASYDYYTEEMIRSLTMADIENAIDRMRTYDCGNDEGFIVKEMIAIQNLKDSIDVIQMKTAKNSLAFF